MLTEVDFREQMFLGNRFVAPNTVLNVSCHWHRRGWAYLTLHEQDVPGFANFAILQVIETGSEPGAAGAERQGLMLLGLTPPDSIEEEVPTYFLVSVLNKQQVCLLDGAQTAKPQAQPIPAPAANRKCNLDALERLLGPVPTRES